MFYPPPTNSQKTPKEELQIIAVRTLGQLITIAVGYLAARAATAANERSR